MNSRQQAWPLQHAMCAAKGSRLVPPQIAEQRVNVLLLVAGSTGLKESEPSRAHVRDHPGDPPDDHLARALVLSSDIQSRPSHCQTA